MAKTIMLTVIAIVTSLKYNKRNRSSHAQQVREKSPYGLERERERENQSTYEGDGDEQLEPECCPSSRVMIMPSEEAAKRHAAVGSRV